MIKSTISKLISLRDVNPAGLANGDTLVWNATAHKFEPGAAGGGGGGGGPTSIITVSSGLSFSVANATTTPFDFTGATSSEVGTAVIAMADGGFTAQPGLYQVDAVMRLRSVSAGTCSALLTYNGLGVLDDGDGQGYVQVDDLGTFTGELVTLSYTINVTTTDIIGITARCENAAGGSSGLSVEVASVTITRTGDSL